MITQEHLAELYHDGFADIAMTYDEAVIYLNIAEECLDNLIEKHIIKPMIYVATGYGKSCYSTLFSKQSLDDYINSK